MLIDLNFDERIMLAECVRYRKAMASLCVKSLEALDSSDDFLTELKIFLDCAPRLVDRLLPESEFENGGD